MKATKYIFIALAAVLALGACSKNVWIDNAEPKAYFAQYGYSQNTVWNVDAGTYTVNFGINIGGLRPDNRKTPITLGFAVNPAIIAAYNADITQEYSGLVEELPASCYSIAGTMAEVPAGAVSTVIPVVFNLTAIQAAGLDAAKRYVVPLELTSVSEYALNEKEMCQALVGIDLRQPSFYFYANRSGVVLASRKLIPDSNDYTDSFTIAGYGVPKGEYTIQVAYDAAAFAAAPTSIIPKSSLIIPEDAVTIKTDQIVYKSESEPAVVKVEYDPSKLEFLKAYYLPLSISSTSAYAPYEEYKTAFVKVEMKNRYEKNYASVLTVHSATTNRTGAYAAKKAPTSYLADVIEMQCATNNTVAGATATAATSATYNNKYMRIKLVPTADPNIFDIEYIRVTDKTNKKQNSAETLEADPDNRSYYDFIKEQFVLNYRWRHPDKATGEWVTVSEIMQAN